MEQNYLIIENNIVTNIVVWDGGSDWTPPADSIHLAQATTPAKIWVLNADKTDFDLVTVEGAGEMGFTWDGSVLSTNQPKPNVPVQPKAAGVTTL